MSNLDSFNLREAKYTKKSHAKPMLPPSLYKKLTWLCGSISAAATGYFLSELILLSGTPPPWHFVAGSITAIALTIAYISREFDAIMEELQTGQKKAFLQRVLENKFNYAIRMTTVIGSCMILYSGADIDRRIQEGNQKAIQLMEEEITRKRSQQENLFDKSIVSATDSTLSLKLEANIESLQKMYRTPESHRMAFIQFLAQMLSVKYNYIILFFVGMMGLTIDLTVSILTQKSAMVTYLSLNNFYRKSPPTKRKKAGDNNSPAPLSENQTGQRQTSTQKKRSVRVSAETINSVIQEYKRQKKDYGRVNKSAISENLCLSRGTVHKILKDAKLS